MGRVASGWECNYGSACGFLFEALWNRSTECGLRVLQMAKEVVTEGMNEVNECLWPISGHHQKVKIIAYSRTTLPPHRGEGPMVAGLTLCERGSIIPNYVIIALHKGWGWVSYQSKVFWRLSKRHFSQYFLQYIDCN